jgi:hypothetical protein
MPSRRSNAGRDVSGMATEKRCRGDEAHSAHAHSVATNAARGGTLANTASGVLRAKMPARNQLPDYMQNEGSLSMAYSTVIWTRFASPGTLESQNGQNPMRPSLNSGNARIASRAACVFFPATALLN